VFATSWRKMDLASNAATPMIERDRMCNESATILVVDDDGVALRTLEQILTKLKFSVLSARDGLEALERFEQHREKIDLVLLDLEMPNLNGREAGRIMRSKAPDLSIVISSGYLEGR